MKEKERKPVKISPAVHREIDIESATEGIPIYVLVERAWAQYKSSGAHPSSAKADTRHNVMELPVSKLHARWYSDLSEILMNGNPDEQATLKGLIEFHAKNIRARSVNISGSAADDGPPQGGHPQSGGARRKHKAD